MTKFKTIKKGLSTAFKYPDRPMKEAEKISLKDRAKRHAKAHPNDDNIPKENKGVQWAKSRKTERDKKLKEFYKTHVYTWVSETNRAWVAIPIMGDEEE